MKTKQRNQAIKVELEKTFGRGNVSVRQYSNASSMRGTVMVFIQPYKHGREKQVLELLEKANLTRELLPDNHWAGSGYKIDVP